ncbi:basic salivary proline-rich protein 1-like [Sciurus carolinensis]|uniref:basic salivary proline-rich protein 1-like n=1 Tax=Sciurus carolinensis TaxID=30640 RepID=UPI001FB40131|nr:basic salivary proline-rich protein 1-like [Sciurus carolinensis]
MIRTFTKSKNPPPPRQGSQSRPGGGHAALHHVSREAAGGFPAPRGHRPQWAESPAASPPHCLGPGPSTAPPSLPSEFAASPVLSIPQGPPPGYYLGRRGGGVEVAGPALGPTRIPGAPARCRAAADSSKYPGVAAASLPSARRSRWGPENLWHRRAPRPPASPQRPPEKSAGQPSALLRLRCPDSADHFGLTGQPGGPGQRPRLSPHHSSPPRRPPGQLHAPRSLPGPHPLPAASTGSQAAGAAQAVTQGGSGDGRSRRRRREQMALKKTQEPAARAHIQLASARRARSAALPLASASPGNASGRRARDWLLSNRTVLLRRRSPTSKCTAEFSRGSPTCDKETLKEKQAGESSHLL